MFKEFNKFGEANELLKNPKTKVVVYSDLNTTIIKPIKINRR